LMAKNSSVLIEQQKIFLKYYENLVNPFCSKVIPVFHLTNALYVYTTIIMVN
jgi:hypothetical protein